MWPITVGSMQPEHLFRLLEEYKIEATLMRTQSAATGLLDHVDGWQKVYGDDIATIPVRKAGARCIRSSRRWFDGKINSAVAALRNDDFAVQKTKCWRRVILRRKYPAVILSNSRSNETRSNEKSIRGVASCPE
jgi:hypothetical protein